MDPLMATMIECRLLSTPPPEECTSLPVPHSTQFDHRENLLSVPSQPVDTNHDLLDLTTGTFAWVINYKIIFVSALLRLDIRPQNIIHTYFRTWCYETRSSRDAEDMSFSTNRPSYCCSCHS